MILDHYSMLWNDIPMKYHFQARWPEILTNITFAESYKLQHLIHPFHNGDGSFTD
jgi:hypothetical protein